MEFCGCHTCDLTFCPICSVQFVENSQNFKEEVREFFLVVFESSHKQTLIKKLKGISLN